MEVCMISYLHKPHAKQVHKHNEQHLGQVPINENQ